MHLGDLFWTNAEFPDARVFSLASGIENNKANRFWKKIQAGGKLHIFRNFLIDFNGMTHTYKVE